MSEEPLGSMGPPLKVMVNGQPAWVCCEGCVQQAKADPNQTPAKVQELKAKVKTDRMLN